MPRIVLWRKGVCSAKLPRIVIIRDMELELQNDLIDYISPKSLLFKEMMYEYFNRLHTFPGTDEFGNVDRKSVV